MSLVAGSLAIAFVAAASPLYAVAAAVTVAGTYLVLARADLMLLVLLAVMPWEGLLNFPTEEVSIVKILGFLLVVSYAIRIIGRNVHLRTDPVIASGAIMLAFILLSLSLSADPAFGMVKMLRYLLFASLLFLVIQLVDNRAHVIRAIAVFVASTSGAAVVGLAFFLQGDVPRAAGPIPEANDFGLVLACVLPLAAFLLVEQRSRRLLWAVCCGALFLGLLATLSRGGLAGLGAAVAWAVVTGRLPVKGLVAAALVALGIAGFVYTSATPVVESSLEQKGNISSSNATSREAFWRAAAYMAAHHPVLGAGPERFGIVGARDYIRESSSELRAPIVHNSYLELAAEDGFGAMLAFIAMLVLSWFGLTRVRRRAVAVGDTQAQRLTSGLQASMVAAVVSGMFLSAQVLIPFWLLAGLASALVHAELMPEPGPAGAPVDTHSLPARARAVPAT